MPTQTHLERAVFPCDIGEQRRGRGGPEREREKEREGVRRRRKRERERERERVAERVAIERCIYPRPKPGRPQPVWGHRN